MVTSDPAIALGNLEGEIADREKKARTGDTDASRELVSRYLTHAQMAGRIADLTLADDASERALSAAPNDPRAHLARAQALSALHEFAAASAELDAAEKLHGDADAIAMSRATTWMATGRENEAAAYFPVVDEKLLRSSDLTLRAVLASMRDDAAESERLFEAARVRYRDVSPFYVAFMDFERGRALLRAGDRARALPYFSEATTVMPSFAHAVVHLAGLEPPASSLPRLESLAKTSDDPDVQASLADAYRRLGRSADAAAAAADARTRFEAVLAKHAHAFADHAASFYLGMGNDTGRALVLTKLNADNRRTAESVELWLTAAEGARDRREACAAGDAARALEHAPSGLLERAARACR